MWLHFINITVKTLKKPVILNGNTNFHKFQESMFLYSIQQNSKQFHIKSALFTVALRLALKTRL